MDIWSKKKRSAVMAKIRSKDTKPEWIVRRYLFSRGYRYRKNVKGLPGTPDIVLRKYGIVIFIHGCFWHAHNCSLFKIPSTNKEFWIKKFEQNKLRDIQVIQTLLQNGWRVLVVWECSMKGKNKRKFDSLIEEIEMWLNGNIDYGEISSINPLNY